MSLLKLLHTRKKYSDTDKGRERERERGGARERERGRERERERELSCFRQFTKDNDPLCVFGSRSSSLHISVQAVPVS